MLGQVSVFCLTGMVGTGLRILSLWKGWDRSQDSVSVERLGQVSVFCLRDMSQYSVLLEWLGQVSVFCLTGKAGTGLSIL